MTANVKYGDSELKITYKLETVREKRGRRHRETGILAVHSHGNLKFLLHGLYQDNNLVGVLLWQQSKPDEPAAFFFSLWNNNTLQTLWAIITYPTNSTANDQRQRHHCTGAKAICNPKTT